jgi:hypothetical protein
MPLGFRIIDVFYKRNSRLFLDREGDIVEVGTSHISAAHENPERFGLGALLEPGSPTN